MEVVGALIVRCPVVFSLPRRPPTPPPTFVPPAAQIHCTPASRRTAPRCVMPAPCVPPHIDQPHVKLLSAHTQLHLVGFHQPYNVYFIHRPRPLRKLPWLLLSMRAFECRHEICFYVHVCGGVCPTRPLCNLIELVCNIKIAVPGGNSRMYIAKYCHCWNAICHYYHSGENITLFRWNIPISCASKRWKIVLICTRYVITARLIFFFFIKRNETLKAP